jgi:hypothetical protein
MHGRILVGIIIVLLLLHDDIGTLTATRRVKGGEWVWRWFLSKNMGGKMSDL